MNAPRIACISALLTALLSPLSRAAAPTPPAGRPQIRGMIIPDHSIIIDGRNDEWPQLTTDPQRYSAAANDAAHLTFAYPERGSFTGPEDLSIAATLAADSENLYIFADVHDQILINDAGEDNCYSGDDFEFFIDANPPEARFAKAPNENVRQLIFIPAHVNPRLAGTFIWQSSKYPGVQAASRLRPWGYSIEIKVPKALFPNWAAHPQMDSIGMDICLNDADAPGVDLYHAAIKDAMFLLEPAAHFVSPERLGLLTFEPVKPASAMTAPLPQLTMSADALIAALATATDKDASPLAQEVLDAIAAPQAARIAAAALASSRPVLRRCGALVFAKRAELDAPIAALTSLIDVPLTASSYGEVSDPTLRSYAPIALAKRHQLPVQRFFPACARLADPGLRLTFIWCCGINGDKAILPELSKLLFDGNIRIRNMTIISLAALGDAATLPALQETFTNDPHHYARAQAELAIKQIKAATGKGSERQGQ